MRRIGFSMIWQGGAARRAGENSVLPFPERRGASSPRGAGGAGPVGSGGDSLPLPDPSALSNALEEAHRARAAELAARREAARLAAQLAEARRELCRENRMRMDAERQLREALGEARR